MSWRHRQLGVAFCAVLVVGCTSQTRRVTSAPMKAGGGPTPFKSASVVMTSSDEWGTDDMDGSQDAVMEGKAASDFQQHTFPPDGSDFDPFVDPTGKRMVFASTRHAQHSNLYMNTIGGASVTQITDASANDVQPNFSPDGRRVAFASDRGGNWDIWVVDLDGRNPMQLTRTPQPELHPSWSPDGKQIVYCRLNPKEGRGELWVISLDTPGTRRFIGDGLFPAWSPSGDKIAYQRARQRGSRWFSIWTIEYLNNEPRFPTEVAASSDAALIAPAWSPDGMRLAFAMASVAAGSRSTGMDSSFPHELRSGIGIVNADGFDRQVLTDRFGGNFSPCWAVDGRIYFTVKVDQSESIWSVLPHSTGAIPEGEAPMADKDSHAPNPEPAEHMEQAEHVKAAEPAAPPVERASIRSLMR